MRLFVTPLIRTLRMAIGDHPFLKYLDSFRYLLAGEFAMDVDLARRIRMPPDWGLEIGVLAEVYRNCGPNQICQVDIADAYDHKHQDLSRHDPGNGLQKMAIDIAQNLFRTLASEGVALDAQTIRTIRQQHHRLGSEFVERYEIEARLNGLHYDRQGETHAVDGFTDALDTAAEQAARDPLGVPWIPSWDHVTTVAPGLLEMFHDAVEADNRPTVPARVQSAL
jgi:glucosyl-3-phosphoglycerate synthase